MITKLTKAQEAKMPEYVKKYIGIGTDTKRLEYDRTVDVIHDLQKYLLDQEPTPVIIMRNPLEAWVACNYAAHGHHINELKGCVDDYFNGKKPQWAMEPFVTPYLNGSFTASVFAFYDFFRDELKVDFEAIPKSSVNADLPRATKNVNELYEIWKATTELGLIYNLVDVAGTVHNMCIVSEKPSVVKLNERGMPHCDGGPALDYEGYGDLAVYALNGVIVPKWLAVTHASKIPIEKYNEITNADERTEFVAKVGIERMESLGKLIDTYTKYDKKKYPWYHKSEYQLIDMHKLFEGVPYAPHLKMLNQTTGVWHMEAVGPECNTIDDAIKDRYGRNIEILGIA